MASQMVRAFRARCAKWRTSWRAAFAVGAVTPDGDEQEDPQELARVRLTAERAADMLATGEIALVSNPWPRGTREWVLWETSYHAQLLKYEFADTLSEYMCEASAEDLRPLMV